MVSNRVAMRLSTALTGLLALCIVVLWSNSLNSGKNECLLVTKSTEIVGKLCPREPEPGAEFGAVLCTYSFERRCA
eukprot:1691-Amorphochlora_amoeboformis.AAC.1